MNRKQVLTLKIVIAIISLIMIAIAISPLFVNIGG